MDRYVGKRLDGRYEIKEVIGVGGMAVVYKAYDSIEDRIVAIKILKEEFVTNEEFLRRFKNESKAIAVLSHPNIVKVFDVSFGDIMQYIVMEYIEGVTLKEFIEKQGSLRWKDAVHFTIQILRGLQHAHDKGIVHRDVKPQNIMVLADGTIKVTDFGIARFARNEHKTITDKAIGSVHYISPEQAKGELTDEKADIYSVGVILYEMLTGSLPFQAESAVSVAIMQLQTEPKLPTELNPSIPLGLEQITMHAMRKDTVQRYQSAAEMLRDLEQFKRDPEMTFKQSYFVDDSPTKYVGDLYESKGEAEPVEDEAAAKVPIIPVLAGVAVTFVIALVLLAVFLVPKLLGGSGSEFKCPKFIGMKYDEVKDDSKYTFVVQNGYSSEFEYGVIYDQNPQEGRKIRKSTAITLYVSMGPKTVKVPDVAGTDVARAKSMLEAEGFKPVIVERADENVPANSVIETTPAKDSNAYEGSEITIVVSTGAPTVSVEVPSVKNLSLTDAKKLIELKGLTVGHITYVNSSAAMKDYVVSQSPDPSNSKTAGKGTAVDLSVGNGITMYTFSLDLELPKDYIAQYGTISAWINGVASKTSPTIDFWNKGKYTFDFSTPEKELQIVVKLSHENNKYDDYVTLIVDCTTGEVENDYTQLHTYPTKDDSPSSITSSKKS